MQSIVSIILKFLYILPKRKDKSKQVNTGAATEKDQIIKAYFKAQSNQLFDIFYDNSNNLRSQMVANMIRASNIRTRSKLHKIDMTLKVVLRRETRKNNINNQDSTFELMQLLQSLDETTNEAS